jgi:hypothetical protein
MAGISFKLQGLESLREELSKSALDKKLLPAIGLFSLELHNSLKTAVFNTYAIDKSLDTVLIGKSSSLVKRGANLLSSDLTYKDQNLRLAEFPLRTFPGNIKAGARRKGMVTEVRVKRGNTKIVYGRKGNGGFFRKRSENVRFNQIFERQTSRRYPIKPLYAIGLAKMARIMYDYDPNVRRVKNKLSQDILNLL